MRTEPMKVEVAIPIKKFSSIDDVSALIPIGKPFTVSHINSESSGSVSVVLIDPYGERHIFSISVFNAAFREVSP